LVSCRGNDQESPIEKNPSGEASLEKSEGHDDGKLQIISCLPVNRTGGPSVYQALGSIALSHAHFSGYPESAIQHLMQIKSGEKMNNT